ncbi:GNAT family protein [Terribacillus saccharophilus]|uniref:GNAT family N-acetyltransferase n=1 Tax=Terribacillus saccharophilus TaxID=361277 RepID=UPI0039819974
MYEIVALSQSEAESIAYTWKYEGEYRFYDMDQDEEDLALFLDPREREDKIFAVKQKEELIGFLSVDIVEADAQIGFGIRPDLTGRGIGQGFVAFLVKAVQDMYQPTTISLAVAAFNQRAITVYERVGFRETERFNQFTNGAAYPFVRMIMKVKNPSA